METNQPTTGAEELKMGPLNDEQIAILLAAGPDRVRERLCALMGSARLLASTALGRGYDLVRFADVKKPSAE
jgi:hypothetical protein